MIEQNSINDTEVLEIPQKSAEDELKEQTLALQKSPQVISLCDNLDVMNKNAILEFGNAPATQISTFADKLLTQVKSSDLTDSGKMLKQLTTIMSKFDKKDFEEKPQGFIGKLISGGKNALQKILDKYQNIGAEIDKVKNEVVVYKNNINRNNQVLEDMFKENINYYKELEKYVVAGNMVIQQLETEDLPQWEEKAKSGVQEDALNLENLKTIVEMLKQRVYDLEMAKMVALQTAPQIRTIQKGNYKLIQKIHSAFIVTIPVFKTGLVQAITLKQQRVVADGMKALDDMTNEMLIRNAQNAKEQSVQIAKLTGTSSVKIETVQQTWQTIMSGIQETQQIEAENRQLREEGLKQLSQITSEAHKSFRQLNA